MSQLLPATKGGEAALSKSPHTLLLDRRNRAAITGVTDVFSFQENEVVLKIDSGEMILTGQNLHIAKLLLEEGQLHIDGHVDSVIYQSNARHEGRFRFWKRWMK